MDLHKTNTFSWFLIKYSFLLFFSLLLSPLQSFSLTHKQDPKVSQGAVALQGQPPHLDESWLYHSQMSDDDSTTLTINLYHEIGALEEVDGNVWERENN